MGAIHGEELSKSGKMGRREEKILVLVRLRPLSEKELSNNEVADWECINESTVLYRNSLQERSGLPTAYSYDRVFSGDCSTNQVYEEGTKEIALSVVSGINSSVFAYGQTSSGKTYTMRGITEYTVADIYDYIQRHEERAFVLKFSAMEIYNENVRDLLSSDITSLRILDDPEKGTIVEKLTEETVTDWDHLKKLMSICEAQRKIGETSLNEQSSRSHQILKLTIESSAREFLGKENSSTLSASVFFVDLAGSERASQAMSAGTRLKEGCHINRSLLTLGNVIRKLSKGRQGHINYRDSKLTRILQPCLGGNARTTIICTLSPARSHVEQSRNTLLFATCAKEVTTNAQVNVVMSDKALVKHLQKELARLESELKSPAPISSSCNCSAAIRKKDLQIEKMEKKIRELTKQRDLAQSRVEDLLQLIGNDQSPNKQEGRKHPGKWKGRDKWGDDWSSVNGHIMNGVQDGEEENSIEDPLSQALYHEEESMFDMGDPDDQCKDVRCIEMEESRVDERFQSHASPTGENGQILASTMLANGSLRRSSHQNGFSYGTLEERIQDVQRSIDSLASHYPDNSASQDDAADASSSRGLNFSRRRGCRANLVNGSFFPLGKEELSERTPPSEVENEFTERPGAFRRFSLLDYNVNSANMSRNGSHSSRGTDFIEDLKSQSSKNIVDEEITSVQTFVAGLKDAKLQYEKQLGEGQVPEDLRKTLKDVGLDAILGTSDTPLDWTLQFEKLQRAIIELWETCSVSLVHRTYFFLLFNGDPTDSIYLEVELRRLTFLRDTFSHANHDIEGGHAQTLASSEKALKRERETLSKLLKKRFSEEERKKLYQRWDIRLDSKRRRQQLVSKLWTVTGDKDHILESASIVAKLVKFSEQGRALKGMFGLSFSAPSMRRRSYGWMSSKSSLL